MVFKKGFGLGLISTWVAACLVMVIAAAVYDRTGSEKALAMIKTMVVGVVFCLPALPMAIAWVIT